MQLGRVFRWWLKRGDLWPMGHLMMSEIVVVSGLDAEHRDSDFNSVTDSRVRFSMAVDQVTGCLSLWSLE